MHNPMFDGKGRVWFTSVIRPPDNPAYCKEGSTHPSAKLFPVNRSGRQLGDVRSQVEAVHAHRHLLQHASPAVRGGRQRHAMDEQRRRRRCGGLAECETVRADARRTEVAGLDGARAGHQRQREARRIRGAEPAGGSGQGQAHLGLVLRRDDQSRGWVGVGHGARLPWPGDSDQSGREPRGNRACRSLRTAGAASLLAARPRYRPQRRRLDGAGQWTFRQLRPPQMQSAERADGDRPALSRGLGVLSLPRPAVPRGDGLGQRRSELLRLGRSVRHVRARRQRPHRHRQRGGRTAGAGGREVGDLAGALSDRLFRQGAGRPYRRSEDRMEGQGALVHVRHSDDVPRGRRQGHDEQGAALPVAARSRWRTERLISPRAGRARSRGRSAASLSHSPRHAPRRCSARISADCDRTPGTRCSAPAP